MTINDLELNEHHNIVKTLSQDLDRLTRNAQYGSLEDAYWMISNHAMLARRRLRRLARER